jgi:hypothetical protein
VIEGSDSGSNIEPIQGDDPGCCVRVLINTKEWKYQRCGAVPAVFWVTCQCKCDCAERLCEVHRGMKCECQCRRPTFGGKVGPLDEISPWQANAIRCMEDGDLDRVIQ